MIKKVRGQVIVLCVVGLGVPVKSQTTAKKVSCQGNVSCVVELGVPAKMAEPRLGWSVTNHGKKNGTGYR